MQLYNSDGFVSVLDIDTISTCFRPGNEATNVVVVVVLVVIRFSIP